MKDYLLINIRWSLENYSSSQLINSNCNKHKACEKEIKHVCDQATKKGNRSVDVYKACRTFNNSKMLEGTHKKIKNGSNSFDDIEHSTNDIHSLIQQPKEPYEIKKNFTSSQNQAALDIAYTTSHDIRFSTRYLSFGLTLFILKINIMKSKNST